MGVEEVEKQIPIMLQRKLLNAMANALTDKRYVHHLQQSLIYSFLQVLHYFTSSLGIAPNIEQGRS
jgi:hypothetical protein